ncbi:MAG TPA: SET domain-containing protein-lysine N-methyltransferase [Puia sp.]
MTRRLFIRETASKGRGVFCNRLIKKDECIEVCPLLLLPAGDSEGLSNTRLHDHLFHFDKAEGTLALVFGFGSLYNHATRSNASYILDKEDQVMRYYALEDIPPGQEICINYAGDSGSASREWFTSRGIPYKE